MFKKNQDYNYLEIEKNSSENNYIIKEYGEVYIGINFLTLTQESNETTYSFVLTGYRKQAIYSCIYAYSPSNIYLHI